MKLQDQVAVVTGGGRGIGKAIAVALGAEGANVCVTARTGEEIDGTVGQLNQLGADAMAVPCDVQVIDQVENMIQRVVDRWGRIDILINNAGGHLDRQLVVDSDPNDWKQVIESNLLGTYYCCRLAIEQMNGGGKIINVGSGMGHEARPGNSAYNTAKAGVWMFTRCLATEVWQQGIEVNEFIPGPVYTRLTQDRFDPSAQSQHPTFASEQVKMPEDCVPILMFLACHPAGGPTGQSFSLARRPF